MQVVAMSSEFAPSAASSRSKGFGSATAFPRAMRQSFRASSSMFRPGIKYYHPADLLPAALLNCAAHGLSMRRRSWCAMRRSMTSKSADIDVNAQRLGQWSRTRRDDGAHAAASGLSPDRAAFMRGLEAAAIEGGRATDGPFSSRRKSCNACAGLPSRALHACACRCGCDALHWAMDRRASTLGSAAHCQTDELLRLFRRRAMPVNSVRSRRSDLQGNDARRACRRPITRHSGFR